MAFGRIGIDLAPIQRQMTPASLEKRLNQYQQSLITMEYLLRIRTTVKQSASSHFMSNNHTIRTLGCDLVGLFTPIDWSFYWKTRQFKPKTAPQYKDDSISHATFSVYFGMPISIEILPSTCRGNHSIWYSKTTRIIFRIQMWSINTRGTIERRNLGVDA